ncbi:hypothetical protein MP228_000085 [Amoeboaphelidium protococcarum]|nr:hypothetical protein MP228_000085 [Amoeboaphelidium protococcarum]
MHNNQRKILKSLAEALFPQIDGQLAAESIAKFRSQHPLITDQQVSDQDLRDFCRLTINDEHVDYMVGKLEHALSSPVIFAINFLLYLLSTSIGTWLLTLFQFWAPFDQLPLTVRTSLAIQWMDISSHYYPQMVLTRLVSKFSALAMITFGLRERNGLFHRVLQYPPQSETVPQSFQDQASVIDGFNMLNTDTLKKITNEDVYELDYDAAIIGSGAGGGVAAAKLSEIQGFRVLVVEQGSAYIGEDLTLTEESSYEQLFLNKFVLFSKEPSIGYLAGSTLGGGTAVNWSACLDLPQDVRKEWSEEYGVQQACSSEFDKALDKVKKVIGVSMPKRQNIPNQILLDGCKQLGLEAHPVPQNIKDQYHYCGHCSLGCQSRVKQSGVETYLKTAAQNGVQFLINCKVDKIVRNKKNGGLAEHVLATTKDGKRLKINTKLVVLSAGALCSPVVLQRSGFKNRNIGKHLRSHPVALAVGKLPDRIIKPYEGGILTSVCRLNPKTQGGSGDVMNQYYPSLEVPSGLPLLASLAIQYASNVYQNQRDLQDAQQVAADAKMLFLGYQSFSPILVLQRDKDSKGQVTAGSDGNPVVSWTASKHDWGQILLGLVQAYKVLVSQGARVLMCTLDQVPNFEFRQDEQVSIDNPRFQSWLDKYFVSRSTTNRHVLDGMLLSAHQMGTVRMGRDSRQGACNPRGQLYECPNIWVCDGSVFPTASGVNPMLTILTMSEMISDQCKEYVIKSIISKQ